MNIRFRFVEQTTVNMKPTNTHRIRQAMQLTLYAFILCLFFPACMSIKYAASPGRIHPDSLAAHNHKFNLTSRQIDSQPKEKYEVIGHALSSWRYYPMNVSSKGVIYGNGLKGAHKQTKAHSIVQLIDKSVGYDPNMSLEMDVQYIPTNAKVDTALNRERGFIMHDIPKWRKGGINKPEAVKYLTSNTLKVALDHIVHMKYYEKCNVYIEIKVTRKSYQKGYEYLNDDQCSRLANELTSYVRTYKRATNKNWLSIYSFSPTALAKLRSYMPDDVKSNIDYILVAGYTPLLAGAIAWFKGYIPRFNSKRSDFLETTDWVSCVWFSAQGIPSFKKRFHRIDAVRHLNHPEWPTLTYSYATYPKEHMDKIMLKRLKQDEKVNIRSFMLDMDEEKKEK